MRDLCLGEGINNKSAHKRAGAALPPRAASRSARPCLKGDGAGRQRSCAPVWDSAALNFAVHMAYCIAAVPLFISTPSDAMLAVGMGEDTHRMHDLAAFANLRRTCSNLGMMPVETVTWLLVLGTTERAAVPNLSMKSRFGNGGCKNISCWAFGYAYTQT